MCVYHLNRKKGLGFPKILSINIRKYSKDCEFAQFFHFLKPNLAHSFDKCMKFGLLWFGFGRPSLSLLIFLRFMLCSWDFSAYKTFRLHQMYVKYIKYNLFSTYFVIKYFLKGREKPSGKLKTEMKEQQWEYTMRKAKENVANFQHFF